MIRSVVYIKPKGGRSEDVIRFYQQEHVFEHALEQPGCLSGEIQVAVGGGDELLVTALWESAEAYQGWVDNPVRATLVAKMTPLIDENPESFASKKGTLYEVAHAVVSKGTAKP